MLAAVGGHDVLFSSASPCDPCGCPLIGDASVANPSRFVTLPTMDSMMAGMLEFRSRLQK
jgi:hypothetical protein